VLVQLLILNHNPLHLIERDLIARAVIELRGPRRFVRGDHCGVFEGPSLLKICRNPGRAAIPGPA
jgi:hypothetical protein